MTQRQIADKSGISYQTVSRTLQALIDSNFLQRINQGAYRVNPDVLFKGGKNARMNVLLQYHDAAAEGDGSNDSAAIPEEQYEVFAEQKAS
ncbi:replication/maintenance protein RepL [Selenomonas infelix]|nr:replication/maintenance protein RepL [Selenomonas infelix]